MPQVFVKSGCFTEAPVADETTELLLVYVRPFVLLEGLTLWKAGTTLPAPELPLSSMYHGVLEQALISVEDQVTELAFAPTETSDYAYIVGCSRWLLGVTSLGGCSATTSWQLLIAWPASALDKCARLVVNDIINRLFL
ncbi:hypothetical protein MRX96_013405 [Rhipicephalus microplus]